MGIANPPNNAMGGGLSRGHSSTPAPTIAGRGAMPTGDRFRLPTPPADAFPPAAVAPGQGAIPVQPYGPGGLPNRIDVSIPDAAGIVPRPPR